MTTARIAAGILLALLGTGCAYSGPPIEAATSGVIRVQAGWTVGRLVDLEIDFRKTDGMANQLAECSSQKIAGSTPWRQWDALTPPVRIGMIGAASRACQAETTP